MLLLWALSGDWGATGCTGHSSLGLESLLRRVGGPVGVSEGFWMGGGLAEVGWGDGGRCFIPPGDGGRLRGLSLAAEGEGVLLGVGSGAGEGERWRPRVLEGEEGRFPPGDVNLFSFREGSRAPSAETEVVRPAPLFCRSMLRLRRGPRAGFRGLAETERGHR